MSVEQRSIIVTGGGQGIGAAIARDLAAHGAKIVAADLNAEKAAAVAGEIEGAGGNAVSTPTDVADPQSVQAMVDAALSAHGRLDGLINCAAIFATIKMKRFEDISLEEWEAVMRVNTTGTFLTCKAVAAPMRKAGFGRIINFSSQAVTRGRVDYLHYIASKSAIIGMTRSLAREL
ncbi:MAG: SDR family NAD(P)-dependent oxidoreductase, partial [Alphaproteobacteria bacterium]|nr:SDR family NAD(P)-dependent oxidoreductase [Alphaproteobacteria bacterium]